MSEILTDHSGLDKYQKLLRATPELPILLVSANSKQAPAESIGSPLEGSLPGALLLFPLNFILGRTRCGQGGLNGKSEDLQDEEEFLSPKEGIMIGSRQGTNDRSRAWVTDQAGDQAGAVSPSKQRMSGDGSGLPGQHKLAYWKSAADASSAPWAPATGFPQAPAPL